MILIDVIRFIADKISSRPSFENTFVELVTLTTLIDFLIDA